MYHQVADDAVCRRGKYQIQDVAMDVHGLHCMLIQIQWQEKLLEVLSFIICCILKVITEVSNHYKTATSCSQAIHVPRKLIQECTGWLDILLEEGGW